MQYKQESKEACLIHSKDLMENQNKVSWHLLLLDKQDNIDYGHSCSLREMEYVSIVGQKVLYKVSFSEREWLNQVQKGVSGYAKKGPRLGDNMGKDQGRSLSRK